MLLNNQQNVPKRAGVHNDGMKYETQVIALLASRLAQSQSIVDYWIISSPKFVNGFDDIIAIIQDTAGRKYVVMLQLKHSEKIMRFITYNPITLLSSLRRQMDSNDYKSNDVKYLDIPLYKYLKTYNKCIARDLENKELQQKLMDIPFEHHYFGIFTNIGANAVVELEKGTFSDVYLLSSIISKNSILNYITATKEHSQFPNICPKGYEEFFPKFHFFLGQPDSKNIYKELQASIPGFTNHMIDNLCNLIGRSVTHNSNVCLPLTKALYFEKYLEVRLSQTLLVHTNSNGKFKPMADSIFEMWQSIYRTYNVTIIANINPSQIILPLYCFYERQIRYEYDLPNFSWHECVENCFRLNEVTVEKLKILNVTSTHLIDLLIYMWKENKIPLIIDDKTKDCFKSVIYTLYNLGRQYILMLDGNEKIDIPNNIKIFSSMYNLINETYFGNIMQLQASLQGRTSAPLKEIIGDSVAILKAIAPTDVIIWTYNSDQPILIGKPLKRTEKCYMKRQFYVFDETRNEQYIVENLRAGLTAISNEPGAGKSTTIVSLALICEPTSFVLTYDLADCGNELQLDISKIHSEPIDFFFERYDHEPTQLLRTIYEYKKSIGGIILFVDSFDEILPLFMEKVLLIFEKMSTIPVLITTRTQAVAELQNRFQSINVIKLKELDDADIKVYCQNYGISKEIYELMPRGMLTTPLHLAMFCSVYQKRGIDATYVTSARFYEVFVEQKVRIYFEKIKICDVNNQYRLTPEKAIDDHIKIALVCTFGRNYMEKLHIIDKHEWFKVVDNFNEYKMALGILSSVESQSGVDDIRFVHKTFAEYFVARWLFKDSFAEYASQSVYRDVIGYSRYNQVFKFLCELKSNNFQSIISDIEKLKLVVVSRDQWGLLPIQWSIMNLYHTNNCTEKRYKLDIFERVLFYSAIIIEGKDVEILARCFINNDLFWRNVVNIAKQFNREHIIDFVHLLKNLTDSSWFSNYVELLFEFKANRYEWPDRKISTFHTAYLLENNKIMNFLLDSRKMNLNTQNNDGDTILHIACLRGSRSVVKLLLAYKADPNIVNNKKKTCLHNACNEGYKDIIHLLLRENADPFLEDRDKRNCLDVSNVDVLDFLLQYASSNGMSSLARTLIQYKANPNATTSGGFSSLHLACQKGNIDIVRILLRHNADPHLVDKEGRNCLDVSKFKQDTKTLGSLLHDACVLDKFDIVCLLLKYGANPNVLNNEQFSSLYVACRNGNLSIVEKLLHYKADPKLLSNDFQNSLHAASCGNNVNIVRLMLKYNLDPNQATLDGSTCLHLACKNGNMEVAELLLHHGAKPKLLNSEMKNSLHAACLGGNVNLMELMVKYNLDLDQRMQDGSTCLHLACQYGNEEIVTALLSKGANPNLMRHGMQNCLHIASCGNNVNVIKIILNCNLDPNMRTRNGFTCLHLACQHGNVEVVKILLEHQADPTLLNIYGENSLHMAARGNNVNVVELMLILNLDPNQCTFPGMTCLQLACVKENEDTVATLLNYGADPRLLTKSKQNCLHIACRRNSNNVVKMLLKHDLDPNQQTLDGSTCLHLACLNANPDIVETLLRHKANPNLLNSKNESSLHATFLPYLKFTANRIRTVELLLTYGANVNEEHEDYGTVLHIACRNGYSNVVELLLRHGADPYKNSLAYGGNCFDIACTLKHGEIVNTLSRYFARGKRKKRESIIPISLSITRKQ